MIAIVDEYVQVGRVNNQDPSKYYTWYSEGKSIGIEWSAPAPGYSLRTPPNLPDERPHEDPLVVQGQPVVRLTASRERNGMARQYETVVPSTPHIAQ